MDLKSSRFFLSQPKTGLSDCRGFSLLVIVFLITSVAVMAVGGLSLIVKLRAVEKERLVPERLDTIRQALQWYYLSHHDLPLSTDRDTDLDYTVPTKDLNLPQKYRFDSKGQFIRYDCSQTNEGTVDIQGLTVQTVKVAAVLIARGPDGQISPGNLENPYADPGESSDDIVVAVSLRVEAIKIAGRAVAVLQMAARAYDDQFYNINNDGDTCYPIWSKDDMGTPDPSDDVYKTPLPIPFIDEDGYVPAEGGIGTNCVRYNQLTNDPDRGTASLDECSTAVTDIIDVFGLNSHRYAVDPWGNPYLWGSASEYGGHDILEEDDNIRNRRYWTFYSMGPDKIKDTRDDITPSTDRIDGYRSKPEIRLQNPDNNQCVQIVD